jgi:hypothetical protein
VIDAKSSITDQQRVVRKVITQHVQIRRVEMIDDDLV